MNILIIHEIDWFTKVIFEPHHLAELFSKQGHDVFVIDCKDANIHNFTKGIKTQITKNYHRVYDDASITIIRPPSIQIRGLNRITHFFSCKKIIKKTIVENNIDIILLYGSATNGLQSIQAAKELKIPIIYRLLDVSHGLVKIPIVRQLARYYEKTVIQKSLKILATTPDLTRYAIEMGANKDDVETFPLGINTTIFKPMKKDIELANTLGISKDDSVIVFVGTIYDFAGLDYIISNFDLLKNKIPPVKFLIIGGGPSFNKIKSMANNKPEIILVGFKTQNDLPRYISLADICVNSFEVNYVTDRILPTKILEYLACGKPVLSTPLKGTKELLPTEEFGILYSNLEQFIETLSDLLNNKQRLEKLGLKGNTYVMGNHNWNILSSQLIDQFKQIVHCP
jgi:glycosyltransferase involved in cell wall biosynthesis